MDRKLALRHRHHEDAIRLHIEELVDRGWTYILWSTLGRWYGKKITKSVYRDLRERFLLEIEMLGGYSDWKAGEKRLAKDLWIYFGAEGALLLHFDGLMSLTQFLGEPAVAPEPPPVEEDDEELGIPRRRVA